MPEQKWIVDQLLPVGGALYLYGMPKTGKSLLALGLSKAIVDVESQWLTLPVNRGGKVLYIQMDMPPTLWHSYIIGVVKSGAPLKDLFIIDRWELPDHRLNLMKGTHEAWLKSQVDIVQPQVVIFDTLRSLHTLDENDNSAMSNLYEKLLHVVGGASLIIVHHSRKPSEFSDIISDARGATSVSGKVDVVAQLSGHPPKKSKLNYLTRDLNTHPDGLLLRQNANGLFDLKPDIPMLLADLRKENLTPKDMIDRLIEAGVSRSQAYKMLNE